MAAVAEAVLGPPAPAAATPLAWADRSRRDPTLVLQPGDRHVAAHPPSGRVGL